MLSIPPPKNPCSVLKPTKIIVIIPRTIVKRSVMMLKMVILERDFIISERKTDYYVHGQLHRTKILETHQI